MRNLGAGIFANKSWRNPNGQAQPQTIAPTSAATVTTTPSASSGQTCSAVNCAATPTGQANEASGQA